MAYRGSASSTEREGFLGSSSTSGSSTPGSSFWPVSGFISLIAIAALIVGAIGLWKAYNQPQEVEPVLIYEPEMNWWPQQGRDQYGSRYFSGFEGNTYNTLASQCLFDTITATTGISAGLISDPLGDLYFGDLGNGYVGSNIWSIDQQCTRNWNVPMSTLISETVYYGADNGTSYLYANVPADMTLIRAENETFSLIFTDGGTWYNYSAAYCGNANTTANICGVRIYRVDPYLNGQLEARSLLKSGLGAAIDSSQTMTSGLNTYGSWIFGGMNSAQSYMLGQPTNPNYNVENFNGFTFAIGETFLSSGVYVSSATKFPAPNYGAAIMGGNTPIDDRFNIYTATNAFFNWSATEYACFATGRSIQECVPALGFANAIIVDNIFGRLTSSTVFPLLIKTPEGMNAWNTDCLNNAPGVGNCPLNATKGYGFFTNLMIVEKRQLLLAKSSSGALYAYSTINFELVGQVYVGPGSQTLDATAMATDGDYAYINVPNPDKLSYIATDLSLRCDGAHVKVSLLPDSSFMTVLKRVPNVCSRASLLCPAIVADTSLYAAGFTYEDLTYASLTTTPISSAQKGPCGISDPRDSATYAMSIGGPVVTDHYVYTNSMNGYICTLDKNSMEMAQQSATRCPTGTPIGGITLHPNQIVATSCGAKTPLVPNSIGDTHVMLVKMQ